MKNKLRYLTEDLLDIPSEVLPIAVLTFLFLVICITMSVLSILNGIFPSGPWHVLF